MMSTLLLALIYIKNSRNYKFEELLHKTHLSHSFLEVLPPNL
jgi:hypothetical protein